MAFDAATITAVCAGILSLLTFFAQRQKQDSKEADKKIKEQDAKWETKWAQCEHERARQQLVIHDCEMQQVRMEERIRSLDSEKIRVSESLAGTRERLAAVQREADMLRDIVKPEPGGRRQYDVPP